MQKLSFSLIMNHIWGNLLYNVCKSCMPVFYLATALSIKAHKIDVLLITVNIINMLFYHQHNYLN